MHDTVGDSSGGLVLGGLFKIDVFGATCGSFIGDDGEDEP